MDGKHRQQSGPDARAARHAKVCTQTCAKGGNILIYAQLPGQLVDRDWDGANTALRGKGNGCCGPDALEEADGAQLAHELDQDAFHNKDLNAAQHIRQHQNAEQRNEIRRRRPADCTGDQGKDRIRGKGDHIADYTPHYKVAGVNELFKGCCLFGLLGCDLVVADSHQNAEHHNGHHLAVGPVRSQILREQADDRIHKGRYLLGGVIGSQFILHPAANVRSHTGDQGDQAGNKGVQHQKEHGLETDLLQTDGIAQISDAGNDAEDQQRNDHGGDHMGVNGAYGCHVSVVPLERKTHDHAKTHGKDGAHAKINVLFLVQIIQQCKKYCGERQCAQIQNFDRHKTLPFLLFVGSLRFRLTTHSSFHNSLPFPQTHMLCVFYCLKGVYSPSGQLSIENSYFPILFVGKSGIGARAKRKLPHQTVCSSSLCIFILPAARPLLLPRRGYSARTPPCRHGQRRSAAPHISQGYGAHCRRAPQRSAPQERQGDSRCRHPLRSGRSVPLPAGCAP